MTWGSWQWGHRGAGSGSGPCHGRGQPGLQVPTLACWSWGHSGTRDTAELRTQWDKGHGTWGCRYLLQQKGVPVTLGQVVGSEGALDASPDDDDVVGGLLGLAAGSHVCPRPRPCPTGSREPSQGEGRGRVRPSRAGGGALAALQSPWRQGTTGPPIVLPTLQQGPPAPKHHQRNQFQRMG